MEFGTLRYLLISALLGLVTTVAGAAQTDCKDDATLISFVQFQSPNLLAPQSPLTIKGKLSLPANGNSNQRCLSAKKDVPAVVVLHGSSGIDSRGDFYAAALMPQASRRSKSICGKPVVWSELQTVQRCRSLTTPMHFLRSLFSAHSQIFHTIVSVFLDFRGAE